MPDKPKFEKMTKFFNPRCLIIKPKNEKMTNSLTLDA